jgi:hypothetical protein
MMTGNLQAAWADQVETLQSPIIDAAMISVKGSGLEEALSITVTPVEGAASAAI